MYFFFFFFKLYIIVLVLPSIKMNPSQVYMCSPSWTLLPPTTPHHPSRSSQRTSPKHPVSCIEPGLASRFIHDILHVSVPFSQIFPPSPSPTEFDVKRPSRQTHFGEKPMAGLPKGFKESNVGQKTNGAHTRGHYHVPDPALDTGNILSSTKNLQSGCWESNCGVKT